MDCGASFWVTGGVCVAQPANRETAATTRKREKLEDIMVLRITAPIAKKRRKVISIFVSEYAACHESAKVRIFFANCNLSKVIERHKYANKLIWINGIRKINNALWIRG
jgi:hypothetical protein